eukprot:1263566-Pyramimonas_sp.AAC.1
MLSPCAWAPRGNRCLRQARVVPTSALAPDTAGSFSLERSPVSEMLDLSTSTNSGSPAAFNAARQRRGRRWSTQREPT